MEKRNLVLNIIKNKKNQQYLKYTVDSINLKLASTEVELIEIKKLQNQNLKGNLSPEKIFEEGFLTADYTLSYLKEINQKNKAIILKKKKVIGYALAITAEVAKNHTLLSNLFTHFNNQVYKNKLLGEQSYIVVGQLCIDEKYRGMGYVEKIYSLFRETYSNYRYCVTAIDSKNKRSKLAHQRCGFKKIGDLKLNESPGDIIIWEW